MALLLFFRVPALHPLFFTIRLTWAVKMLNPHNPDTFFAIGENFFGQGRIYDPSRAEAAYARAVALRPDFMEAHYQLGRVYFIQGRFTPAIMEMTTVMRLNPDFKKTYYMYGLIQGYNANYSEAIYGFTEFIKRDDFNWAGYNDLAWVYFLQGDYEKARDTSKKGLERAHNNPWLHNLYGAALMNLGSNTEAQASFELALEQTELLTPARWGGAYPGNDPRLYPLGLDEMKTSIQENLALVNEKLLSLERSSFVE